MRISFFSSSHRNQVPRRQRAEIFRATEPIAAARRFRRHFWLGLCTGVVCTVTVLTVGLLGSLRYMASQADQSVEFAHTPAVLAADNRVEMYFPLERFLTWRSTASITMNMQNQLVHVHLNTDPFPALHLTLGFDIYGKPGVVHGDFALSQVAGYVDHIPLPRALVLGAIAADGARFGVRVNAKRDTLYVIKSLGDYRLIGYDQSTGDLVLSLPVQAVERAARSSSAVL